MVNLVDETWYVLGPKIQLFLNDSQKEICRYMITSIWLASSCILNHYTIPQIPPMTILTAVCMFSLFGLSNGKAVPLLN
jgi:hypothetical protein